MAEVIGIIAYEKQADLWTRFRNGDYEARNELIEANVRLVWHTVKSFKEVAVDPDDLGGWGIIGLIKAVDTFNCSFGTKFSSYACRCIRNEIMMALRAEKKITFGWKMESIDDEISSEKNENISISLHDILPSGMDIEGNAIGSSLEHDVRRCFHEDLEEREKNILWLRNSFWSLDSDRTQREVAEMLGISTSYVSRIEKRAKKKIAESVISAYC